MGATTIGTTGTQFGVLQAESGVIIQRINRASQRQKKEIIGYNGEIDAVGYYAPKAVYAAAGVLLWPNGLASGLTGLAASAYPGGVVALANVLNDTSTTGGHVYCEEFTIEETAEDFVKFTGSFAQYPSISTP